MRDPIGKQGLEPMASVKCGQGKAASLRARERVRLLGLPAEAEREA